MPILFVVKRSRARLLVLLRQALERRGVVMVLLDRRRHRRRHRDQVIPFEDRREHCRRQPLETTAVQTWAQLGVLIRQVRTLPLPKKTAVRAAPRARSPSRPSARRQRARRGGRRRS